MVLSGTSIAAPAVSGAVALMLQANPGLTPPLIKAILQYTAQPLPGASLVQQGAGSLNVEGAVRLAGALRTDIAGAVAAGTIRPGDSLLRSGKIAARPGLVRQRRNRQLEPHRHRRRRATCCPGPRCSSRYQGFYDPRVVWSRRSARGYTPVYWPTTPANTYMNYAQEKLPGGRGLVTSGVVHRRRACRDEQLRRGDRGCSRG